jgi:hypothetical protein
MENFAKDLITALQYLLPGFISAWVFYGFTSYPKPSQFERTVQALIFTMFIQAIVYAEKTSFFLLGRYVYIATWNESSFLICSIVSAVLFGFALSYFANNDNFHKFFRKIGITRETSYASEWFSAFLNNVTYIVLHLEDERRLYGWPLEWPSEPRKGHFLLTDVSWLDEEKEIPITGVNTILVDAKDVKWVEFMKKTWERKNE